MEMQVAAEGAAGNHTKAPSHALLCFRDSSKAPGMIHCRSPAGHSDLPAGLAGGQHTWHWHGAPAELWWHTGGAVRHRRPQCKAHHGYTKPFSALYSHSSCLCCPGIHSWLIEGTQQWRIMPSLGTARKPLCGIMETSRPREEQLLPAGGEKHQPPSQQCQAQGEQCAHGCILCLTTCRADASLPGVVADLVVSTCMLEDEGCRAGGAHLRSHLLSSCWSSKPKPDSLANGLVCHGSSCRARAQRVQGIAPGVPGSSKVQPQGSARCTSATCTAEAHPARGEHQSGHPSQASPLQLLVLSKVPLRGGIFHAAACQDFACLQRQKERRFSSFFPSLFLLFLGVLSWVGLEAVLAWTGVCFLL